MSDNCLYVDQLSKSYGDVVALKNMSFQVAPGEIYGFVGSNGAGKTTAMRIILGVLEADSGEVRIGSSRIDDTLRRFIGYMPEERGLYPKERIANQLIYFARLHGLTAERAKKNTDTLLEQLGLSDRADDKVDSLSLGNQQRVQLAAALVFDPHILILDEPFSGLDPVAVELMASSLRERAAQGVPVVFSSHQLDLVQRLCHRVGIISAGEMRAEGSVDELRQSGPLIYEITVDSDEPWWEQMPELRLINRDGSHIHLHVDAAAASDSFDDQRILHTALRYGAVHHFGRRLSHLSELFQEVVAP